MQAIIFALVSYFSWGTGILFEAIAAKKFESYSFVFCGFLIGFLMSLLYAPFVLTDLNNLSLSTVLLSFLIAIGFIAGTIIYYEALKIGNPSLTGTIASSFPLLIVVYSLLLFGEKVSLPQLGAIATIIFGLFLGTLDLTSLKQNKSIFNKASLLALVTMFLWGTGLTIIKIPISRVGWFWPNFFIFSFFPFIYLYMRVKRIKLEIPKDKRIIIWAILAAILVRVAEFSYNLGISSGSAAIVAPIAGANPTLFVILSFFVFKDKLTKLQITGIITTLTGIVLLSYLSV